MTCDVCVARYNKQKFFRFPATLTPTGSRTISSELPASFKKKIFLVISDNKVSWKVIIRYHGKKKQRIYFLGETFRKKCVYFRFFFFSLKKRRKFVIDLSFIFFINEFWYSKYLDQEKKRHRIRTCVLIFKVVDWKSFEKFRRMPMPFFYDFQWLYFFLWNYLLYFNKTWDPYKWGTKT